MDRQKESRIAMKKIPKPWLPYLVAFIGIIGSFLLWRARHTGTYEQPITEFDPWMDLILSISIALLIAALVGMLQVIRHRAQAIHRINAALKKEIAERSEAEKSKLKLEAALLQGQKLQAIGTLAGGIAHDFNNILYAIIGYVELAQADVPKDSLPHKNLGKALEGTRRGQELISRILAFSRRQHHEYTPINLNQTIESALSLLTPTIPASVMIDYQAETDPLVIGNQNQIHQVIVNIINNAVDAMEGEGTITIRLSTLAKNDAAFIQFPDMLQQDYCKLEITDTGHGMDPAMIGRIFEPFFTTKEVGKGTGLGLSIVHSIIKEHAGRIAVTSKLGHGATFTVLLPIQK